MTQSTKEKLALLLTLHLEGKLTEAGASELHKLLQKKGARALFEHIVENNRRGNEDAVKQDKADWGRIWENIQYKIGNKPKNESNYRKIIFRAAAILLILIGCSALAYMGYFEINIKHSGREALQSKDIAPGHEGAVLTLADGRRVVVDSSTGSGIIATQGVTNIIKQNGQVTYVDNHVSGQEAAISYNTMSTPRARQFRLVLPDGSKVWLNSASSITYPTSFNGKYRSVSVTGEAYFEVHKDAMHPFIVNAANAQVEVLGTHFDVMAYNDEKELNTTLLEGSVRFSAGGKQKILKPGEQARLDYKQSSLSVEKTDTSEAVAWMHGEMSLGSVSISEFLKRISRWYDVDVEVEGTLPDKQFEGMISNKVSLSYILEALSANGVPAEISGNKVIIREK